MVRLVSVLGPSLTKMTKPKNELAQIICLINFETKNEETAQPV